MVGKIWSLKCIPWSCSMRIPERVKIRRSVCSGCEDHTHVWTHFDWCEQVMHPQFVWLNMGVRKTMGVYSNSVCRGLSRILLCDALGCQARCWPCSELPIRDEEEIGWLFIWPLHCWDSIHNEYTQDLLTHLISVFHSCKCTQKWTLDIWKNPALEACLWTNVNF